MASKAKPKKQIRVTDVLTFQDGSIALNGPDGLYVVARVSEKLSHAGPAPLAYLGFARDGGPQHTVSVSEMPLDGFIAF